MWVLLIVLDESIHVTVTGPLWNVIRSDCLLGHLHPMSYTTYMGSLYERVL